MLKAIGHNLARLTRFSGRDTRETFWPYALLLFALAFVGCGLVMVPTIAGSMARMQRFALEHPELATVQQGPGSYSIQIQGSHPELIPDMRPAMAGMAIMAGAFLLLAAAAVARRLHDRGKSGAWGLPPIIFLALGLILMPRVMSAPTMDLSSFFLLFGNNILYLASLGLLVVLLAGEGTEGPNRYGDDPTPPEARRRRRGPPRPRD